MYEEVRKGEAHTGVGGLVIKVVITGLSFTYLLCRLHERVNI